MEKTSEMKHRIVIIGPESTGKTTLCQNLATHYNAQWLPEYARSYIEKLDRPYTYEDVIHIAEKQVELEEDYAGKSDLLFIDTDLILTKVWLLHVYGKCPDWINEWLQNAPRTIYLVCEPDLPWEFDPVRENPEIREYLMKWYCKEIESYNFPYVFISGEGKARVEKAIRELLKCLGQTP